MAVRRVSKIDMKRIAKATGGINIAINLLLLKKSSYKIIFI